MVAIFKTSTKLKNIALFIIVMILKSIRLNNIRSYLNQEIMFPKGSVMLAGDVGAGKSTILLAVEFALFGVSRGNLNGNSLLRNGKKEGSVELKLDVNNKEIIIKRGLKRLKDGVHQTSGFIVRDGRKKEGTATELKSMIFSMLGYPKEYLSKKNLLFRYTVYTPQEEMKQIILENKETRLEVLRKLFGIDKYRRIRENCLIYTKHIKDRQKELSGMIADLEEKQKYMSLLKENKLKVFEKISYLKPELDTLRKNVKEERSKIEYIESRISKLSELKKEEQMIQLRIKNLFDRRTSNLKKINVLMDKINEMQDSICDNTESLEELARALQEAEESLKSVRSNIQGILNDNARVFAMIENSEQIIKEITSLDKCPTCRQDVKEEYKEEIRKRENSKISDLKENILGNNKRISRLKDIEKEISEKIEKLRKQESAIKINSVKERSVKENKMMIKELEKENMLIKEEIAKENTKKISLSKMIEEYKDSESRYLSAKKVLDDLNKKLISAEKDFSSLEKEHEMIQKNLSIIEEEIEKKVFAKNQMIQLSQLQRWIEEYFMNLMSVMEKHLLARVHNEFNSLFEKWFSMLIEDQDINARIDDEFSPLIIQNGYETEIENLSGGEKTACALAYRLCLNKVINDIISDINTKEILILDEPTDGFSAEQLEKMRDVLEEINAKQVIIVSHEAKIESFVDNVIRIAKEEHVSHQLQ